MDFAVKASVFRKAVRISGIIADDFTGGKESFEKGEFTGGNATKIHLIQSLDAQAVFSGNSILFKESEDWDR